MNDEKYYRATQYPYLIPDYSFVFEGGEARPIRTADDMPVLNHRHPVIACGSNLSHERLKQKYGKDAEPLPVIRMQLKNFDTVFAAHFAHYGAIPATLHPSPGTIVSLALNWLSDEQLVRMHETEKDNYHFCKLSRLDLMPEFGGPLDSAYAYISSTGCWTPLDTPIPLAAISATKRQGDSLKQEDALELARSRFAGDASIDSFITGNIDNEQSRHDHAMALQGTTQTFSYDYLEKLDMGL